MCPLKLGFYSYTELDVDLRFAWVTRTKKGSVCDVLAETEMYFVLYLAMQGRFKRVENENSGVDPKRPHGVKIVRARWKLYGMETWRTIGMTPVGQADYKRFRALAKEAFDTRWHDL